ncbi:MAG: dynamin family protein [Thermodesulfobacteriota bacterium]|nr:dynamin family protein [Thermodesulfobacteriota bacterium]
MDNYEDIKNELLDINSIFAGLLTRAGVLSVTDNDGFSQWKGISRQIAEKIQGETLRVAVIGSIKSGKSTFVNCLLEGDYLKRGAGVVTAIVTRIRKGEEPTARLYFKSWDEVNEEMRNATAIFPGNTLQTPGSTFDLRREMDREHLAQALASLGSDHLINRGERNADSVLLLSYLKGFERVKDVVSSESRTRIHVSDDFNLHRNFSGDDSLAIYLKDIQLDVDAKVLNDHLEIADCQGSDSPNPRHLAMIQDYLLVTNLIIYVISTRTGLRRADIRFISMIKKMGIMDNIIFVLNCDFSEHENISDLHALVEKNREELSLICPDPDLFIFSSLYNLFAKTEGDLTEKDRARFDQWRLDQPMKVFSEDESKRFKEAFDRKLTQERYPLLLRNHLGRINLSCQGFHHWLNVRRDLLNSDADRIETIVSRLTAEQKKSKEMSAMIRSTLDGAVSKIQKDIRHEVDHFFDPFSGELIDRVVAFIREYRADSGFIEEELGSVGFTTTLFNLFQQFKHAVDRFMTTSVNPEMMQFIRKCEHRVAEAFDQISKPFEVMVKDTLADYNTTLRDQGLDPVTTRMDGLVRPNPISVKSISELALPPAAEVMNYSARIKSDAVLRYGAYSLARLFRKVFKKSAEPKYTESLKALKDGMRRMKRETERTIKAHFRDYQEGIKFQYLFKFISGYADLIHEALMDHFTAHQTDLSSISDMISDHHLDRRKTTQTLDELLGETTRMVERIDTLTIKLTGG